MPNKRVKDSEDNQGANCACVIGSNDDAKALDHIVQALLTTLLLTVDRHNKQIRTPAIYQNSKKPLKLFTSHYSSVQPTRIYGRNPHFGALTEGKTMENSVIVH
eukprot:snap_masked-scaffold_4-processed-gene-2.37-mRNA-1 protein AED:1.00 eAED:1.00 QI:0/-1/0/0/-1/1/1/0/103